MQGKWHRTHGNGVFCFTPGSLIATAICDALLAKRNDLDKVSLYNNPPALRPTHDGLV
jgi:hypothetical protein